VTPAVWAPLRADQTITVQRVEYVDRTEEVVLERGEVRRNSSSLDRGRTRVDAEGRDGLRLDTYRVTLVDGEETDRELTDSEVVTEPRDRVVLVGTRAPAPAARTSTVGGSVWDRLAQCESNGNWAANTGNGYYGGLQFLPSTWRSVGGSGLPHQASRAEQIRRAEILQARSGWGQWPACSRRLGLR
jgi:resuscitation-promoting factor RpfB